MTTARLIPAHAGKTAVGAAASEDRGAHPRSRGENAGLVHGIRQKRGSSPLTRGKPAALVSAGDVGRLIPAHAGKTGSVILVITGLPAHPRSRGENAQGVSNARVKGGSSPLTRGKLGTPLMP
mgnify:CR=1 FL=1